MTQNGIIWKECKGKVGKTQHLNGNRKVDLSQAPWRMLEFFAGSGLVAYGMQGNFAPIWSNDISEKKARVYRANFQSEHFVQGDICDIEGGTLPAAHLSWASFPCQDLSLAGNLRGIYAKRSGVVWEWLRVLDEMKKPPKILALENVPGLFSASQGKNYICLHEALVQRGYRCGAITLNAEKFVPQSRKRVFVIGVKKGVDIPEKLISLGPNWLHSGALEMIGTRMDDWIWWTTEEPKGRKLCLADLLEQEAIFDRDDVLSLVPEQMMAKLRSMNDVVATGYRRTRQGRQRLELRFDGLAGCLRTPSGGSSKQFVVVRKNGENHARLLTVREAARLMGAPDSFFLPGSCSDGYFAMGDAVVMPVVTFLAERFLRILAEAAYR